MYKWKCTDGITRDINEMTPMHLAMICKMLERKDTNHNRYKLRNIGAKLIRSKLTVSEWMESVNEIRKGTFRFYEDSPELDAYYSNLVRRYKVFLAPRCLQFKEQYPSLYRNMKDVMHMLPQISDDRIHDYGISRSEAVDMYYEIDSYSGKSIAQNFFEGNADRIMELGRLELPCQQGLKYYTCEEILADLEDAFREVHLENCFGTRSVYWPCKYSNGLLWGIKLEHDAINSIFNITMTLYYWQGIDENNTFPEWALPSVSKERMVFNVIDEQEATGVITYLFAYFDI